MSKTKNFGPECERRLLAYEYQTMSAAAFVKKHGYKGWRAARIVAKQIKDKAATAAV